MHKKFFLFLACAVLSASSLRAQVAPAAIGGESRLWVGAEYANFSPDWAPPLDRVPLAPNQVAPPGITRLPGATIYVDFGLRRRFGVEGEMRFLTFTKPGGLTEKSYLGGGYYTAYRRGKLSLDVKFLVGGGLITYSPAPEVGYGSYFVYVPGGNLSYRLARKWKARVDYEYQLMPSAPGNLFIPGLPNGLKPNGFSAGVAYRVF